MNDARREQTTAKLDANSKAPKSPVRQAGILLTPGTGTSRRKRVSFGGDVVDQATKKTTVAGSSQSGDLPAKAPTPWTAKEGEPSRPRPRSKLTEALENSRRERQAAERQSASTSDKKDAKTVVDQVDVDDEWEEDEDEPAEHDMTIDLNEPRSRSGKYWKSEFAKYHDDARVEMEKLVKYKQLAKSYAKMKDTEAANLNEKLKEEQAKVTEMEKKITELAAHMGAAKLKNSNKDNTAMLKELARQTALAVEYREKVKELASMLEHPTEEVTGDKKTRRIVASPRTQQTLVETQRELRRARAQVKENGQLRDEVERLKSKLLFSEQLASQLSDENKRLAEEESRAKTKVHGLEQQLTDAQEEARRRRSEAKAAKEEIDRLKESSRLKQKDSSDLIMQKDDKIAELRRELKVLKAEVQELKASLKTTTQEALKKDIVEDASRPGSNALGSFQRDLALKKTERHKQKQPAEDDLREFKKNQAELVELNKRIHAGAFATLDSGVSSSPAASSTRSRPLSAIETGPGSSTRRESLYSVATGNFRSTAAAEPARIPTNTTTTKPSILANRPLLEVPTTAAASTIRGVAAAVASSSSEHGHPRWRRYVPREQWVPSPERGYEGAAASSERYALYDSPDKRAVGAGAARLLGESDGNGGYPRQGGGAPDSSAVYGTPRGGDVSRASSTLSDNRRAAALARIELRKAERKRTHMGAGAAGVNKENVRPF